MTKHFPIRMVSETGKPTLYVCLCGYSSSNPKEFAPVTKPSMKGVTCSVALEKLNGSVLIMKGKAVT